MYHRGGGFLAPWGTVLYGKLKSLSINQEVVLFTYAELLEVAVIDDAW